VMNAGMHRAASAARAPRAALSGIRLPSGAVAAATPGRQLACVGGVRVPLAASNRSLSSPAGGRGRRATLRRRAAAPAVAVSSQQMPGAVAVYGGGGSGAPRAEGSGVAIVGLGTRGSVVVDRLVAQGVLSAAEFWALNSDTVSLQAAYAPNRWRLPPNSVDAAEQVGRARYCEELTTHRTSSNRRLTQ
jgi:hypothetical protein